jgi:hypothetical protein
MTLKAVRKKKFTRKQLKDIKDAWLCMQQDTDNYFWYIRITEEWLEKKTGIKGISFIRDERCPRCHEIFIPNYGFYGVGTYDREYDLVQMDREGRIIK